jgi:hypothetical protein
LSLRSNPGLELANAFGVKSNSTTGELKLLAVSSVAVVGNDFGFVPLGALP